MKLWKVRIKSLVFPKCYFTILVLADSESAMLRTAVENNDLEKVVSYEQIDLTDKTNRVL